MALKSMSHLDPMYSRSHPEHFLAPTRIWGSINRAQYYVRSNGVSTRTAYLFASEDRPDKILVNKHTAKLYVLRFRVRRTFLENDEMNCFGLSNQMLRAAGNYVLLAPIEEDCVWIVRKFCTGANIKEEASRHTFALTLSDLIFMSAAKNWSIGIMRM